MLDVRTFLDLFKEKKYKERYIVKEKDYYILSTKFFALKCNNFSLILTPYLNKILNQYLSISNFDSLEKESYLYINKNEIRSMFTNEIESIENIFTKKKQLELYDTKLIQTISKHDNYRIFYDKENKNYKYIDNKLILPIILDKNYKIYQSQIETTINFAYNNDFQYAITLTNLKPNIKNNIFLIDPQLPIKFE